ncbi:IclR family transcriptional regulator [Agromyces silvae]|uniref:IclR family transcriptional regulator n=1 Tax=Agromyces silvae TaxID=3388266 RepID=UPI00280A9887|nr:IclR family transcriptional regulator [Agromyces protaetiae]
MKNGNDGAQGHGYHSHALSRGLAIIQAVAQTEDVATLAELHETTGLPKSTLVRLLSVLEDEDYLIKVDERPAYRLGHAILPIAASYMSSASVADLLRPHLRPLAQETGWTANFGILDGLDVVHLCVEFPNRPIHYNTTEGSSSEAYCTGLGKAVFLELSEEAIRRSLPPEPFARRTANTLTTWDELAADLELSRARGYAVDAEEADAGLRCVSVPVVSNGQVLGAVSVSGPAGEGDPETERRFVALLLEARDRIARESGLRGALGIGASPAA